MRRFADKLVLLTGAASGIGKAAVLRMAEEGASIACADVQVEAVEAVTEQAAEPVVIEKAAKAPVAAPAEAPADTDTPEKA